MAIHSFSFSTMKFPAIFFLMLFVFLGCSGVKNTIGTPEVETEYVVLDSLIVTAPPLQKQHSSALPVYNESHERSMDLIHTRLDLRFNWNEESVIGKALLILTPYFYKAEMIVLDAKGFEIRNIRVPGEDSMLNYSYDGEKLLVDLKSSLEKEDTISLLIEYLAFPSGGSTGSRRRSGQGLYFIDPLDTIPGLRPQLWTLGQTEYNSRWFPTIDKPNERCTQEMYLTVLEKYTTLSNGILSGSVVNNDGTRTDYWKMDQPHAPYLFMVAVGEFARETEEWNGIPLEYYVSPEYAEYAKQIFAHTPEMLSFFSELLDYPYPWSKFAQIAVQNYVSGAMENTTSVIFGDFVEVYPREVLREGPNDGIVAHEMFHHWFGDLVTCESWANLTLNEGFANYGEYLWTEYKYGKDQADYDRTREMRGYLNEAAFRKHPLIHFGYDNKESMFDAHSYNKGGLVLHMLRELVGDEAFFSSLNTYLQKHAFGSAEVHDLRLAFEEVTGKDLNWFFSQWFLQSGHPQVTMDKEYLPAQELLRLQFEQTQEGHGVPAIFVLPFEIDIFLENGDRVKKSIILNKRAHQFDLSVNARPLAVFCDNANNILWELKEEKSRDEYVFQLAHAQGYHLRREAIDHLIDNEDQNQVTFQQVGIGDPHWSIRKRALQAIGNMEDPALIEAVEKMAIEDPDIEVRLEAISLLAKTGNKKYISLVLSLLDQEGKYALINRGFSLLSLLDAESALSQVPGFLDQQKPPVAAGIASAYCRVPDIKYLSFFIENMGSPGSYYADSYFLSFVEYLSILNDPGALVAVDHIKSFALNNNNSLLSRYYAGRSLSLLQSILQTRLDFMETIDNQSLMQELLAKSRNGFLEIKTHEKNRRLRRWYSQLGH
jgi:aminopeptidase N